ncbi:MAG: nucleotidyltransferase domain-containing protein [Deinococcaceae bacterium]
MKHWIDTQEHPILYLAKSGSHLFGTHTPQSDLDIKGLFLPTQRSLYLQQAPKQFSAMTQKDLGQKNNSDDIDITVWSLQAWFKLLEKGDMNAISLLFSWTHEDSLIEVDAEFMARLRSWEHQRLLSRSMEGMAGYVTSQAVKYTQKGKRYNILKNVISILSNAPLNGKISDILESLLNEVECQSNNQWKDHVYLESPNFSGNTKQQLVVLGKKYDLNVKIGWALESLYPILDQYGKRAKQASENSVDFKAFSHSMRVLRELQLLHTFGRIVYPHELEFSQHLVDVKRGMYNYETLCAELEIEMAKTDDAARNSILPEHFDHNYAETLLLEWYTQ